jgi:hypothetical protein
VPAARDTRLAEGHELVGIAIRKRAQQERTDAAEDRGVHSDTERQAQHRGEREAGILDQRASSEADVLEHARQ